MQVIGAGSGGLTAAEFAARLGVKVALIEKIELEVTALGPAVCRAKWFTAKMASYWAQPSSLNGLVR